MNRKTSLAYIIGVSIGDGNISNPNGRAYRLRITCDKKYPYIIENIKKELSFVFPKNKISIINRKDNCIDISCYSNKIPERLGWENQKGSKIHQNITIPKWIKENKTYSRFCLRGLFESDGSVYFDRGYEMINFVTHIDILAEDVLDLVIRHGFIANLYKYKNKNTVRISKNVLEFKKHIMLKKDKHKPKILIILGPTATGKSDLAVELAHKHNGEVVSADSRQVYKGLDLGSGKITKKEMRGVPHHLLDVISPNRKIFSVADFQKLAYKAIDDILSRGKLPIVAGGTAFYIQSIVDGIVLPEIKANPKLRAELEKMPLEKLQWKLQKMDPERFQEIDAQNPVRLIRAIEIATELGSVPKTKSEPKYDCIQIGLKLPQSELHQKIALRLEKRMKKGMLAEAKKLHDSGLSWKRMEAMGLEYRFMARHLQNKISREEMLSEIQFKSQQFAKRQMTWFKKDERIKWFHPKESDKISKFTNKYF